ncbi:hypothetical protein TRVA0_027S01684 [Trichomonascus vanleenenianus]|uniref:uncharacterized protein n=1 Tax=Trichomonascus vanleenenianus TaxID=2268995 RepID=UPI003EC98BB6
MSPKLEEDTFAGFDGVHVDEQDGLLSHEESGGSGGWQGIEKRELESSNGSGELIEIPEGVDEKGEETFDTIKIADTPIEAVDASIISVNTSKDLLIQSDNESAKDELERTIRLVTLQSEPENDNKEEEELTAKTKALNLSHVSEEKEDEEEFDDGIEYEEEELKLYHPKPHRVVQTVAMEQEEEEEFYSPQTASLVGGDTPESQNNHPSMTGRLPEFANDEEDEDAESSTEFQMQGLHDPKPVSAPVRHTPEPSYAFAPNDTPQHSVGHISQVSIATSAGEVPKGHRRGASSISGLSRRSILDPRPTEEFLPPIIPSEQEDLIYYPAPIPVQLRLPPLLSKRNKQVASSSRPLTHNYNPNRASVILPPPTWSASQFDQESIMAFGEKYPRRNSMYSMNASTMNGSERASSPALSMDSGRATIESDDEDRNLGVDVEPWDDGEDDDKKLSSKELKKKKRRLRKKKNQPEYLEEFDTDSSAAEEEGPTNIDDLAFTSYDPETIATVAHNMVELGGAVPTTKPTSLIEELELRKASRKARTNLVMQESHMEEAMMKDQRVSRHPLDYRHSRSLMQLNDIAQRDYKEQIAWHQLSRMSKADLEKVAKFAPRPVQDDGADESLAERRARLKREKKAALEASKAESETLAERRARLKREKKQQQQQQQQVLVG